MISEDEARKGEKIEFVLHLGDFVYDEVWYPEDFPDGLLGRSLRDIIRFPTGGRHENLRYPVTLEDYRTLYRSYLKDRDLQAARARWPFICVWDDHEFSQDAWQSASPYAEQGRGAQTRKVAANQAWFEYIPARLHSGVKEVQTTFDAPAVVDAPMGNLDEAGLADEPNNLAAIQSLCIYRRLRWGRHIELFLTDNRSFRSQPVMDLSEARRFTSPFRSFVDEGVVEILDRGRNFTGSEAPDTISFGREAVPNFRRNSASGSMLGKDQKEWLLQSIEKSDATWRIWGNSVGLLTCRVDFQNLPSSLRSFWPTDGFGQYGSEDWSGYPTERAEILDYLADREITNVISLGGDRHNFVAGLASSSLPPQDFRPVAVEFGVSAINTPSNFEVAVALIPGQHPIAPIYHRAIPGSEQKCPTLNISMLHGVQASLEFGREGNLAEALTLTNPVLSPHLSFLDTSSYGFAIGTAGAEAFNVEFVATPPPVSPDDIQPQYRVTHQVEPWGPNDAPVIRLARIEGKPPLPYGIDHRS